jgi:galactose mutarotase-like enzyme
VWPRYAPVLFPIVGKLKDNAFVFEGKEYALSQHGFARDRVFEMTESDPNSCLFQLVSDEESKQVYLFDFVFKIRYTLDKNKLTTQYTVINPSTETLFFSVGAHPGFNCPLLPKEKMESYYLEFEQPEYQLTELSNGLRTDATRKLEMFENKLYLSEQLFENDALVFENNQINRVSLCSTKNKHKITLECEGWPYFGIWSKSGTGFKQQFICLEPWCGIADKESTNGQLAEKEGVIALEPGKTFDCSFAVTIE